MAALDKSNYVGPRQGWLSNAKAKFKEKRSKIEKELTKTNINVRNKLCAT